MKNTKPETRKFLLQLFVTGASPNSIKAISNLKLFCEKHLKETYSLEIIDVYQQPALASKEQIIALPLMIKRSPPPQRKFIGDMSDSVKLFKGLGITEIK